MWSQVIVALLLAALFVGSGFVLFKRRNATVEPEYFQYTSPRAYLLLFCFRVLALSFFAITLTYKTYVSFRDDSYNFIYYSNWNFTAQLLYFTWMLKFQSFHWKSHCVGSLLVTREGRILNTFFDVIFAASLVVALVYWAVLYPTEEGPLTWVTVATHGINTVLVIVEYRLNHLVTQWSNVVYASFLWPGTYSLFAVIAQATWLGFWPYFFLDTSKPVAPAWYLGLLAIHFVFNLLTIGASKLKQRFLPALVAVPEGNSSSPKGTEMIPFAAVV
jgi:hypothetical protein